MGYFIDSHQPLHKLSQTFQMAGCMNGYQLENLQISPGLLYSKRESPDPAQDLLTGLIEKVSVLTQQGFLVLV